VLWIESVFWTLWLTDFVQIRWAASFHTNEISRILLRSRNPSIFFTLPTHLPLAILATSLLIVGIFAHHVVLSIIAGTLLVEPATRLIMEAGLRKYGKHLVDAAGRIAPASSIASLTVSCFTVLVSLITTVGFALGKSWLIWLGGAGSLVILGAVLIAYRHKAMADLLEGFVDSVTKHNSNNNSSMYYSRRNNNEALSVTVGQELKDGWFCRGLREGVMGAVTCTRAPRMGNV
jgi:hypothetical protein